MIKYLSIWLLICLFASCMGQNDFSQLNYAVFHAHNKARADPKYFSGLAKFELENEFIYRDGKPTNSLCLSKDFVPKSSVCYFTMRTQEGARAWEELINDFNSTTYNLQPLRWSEGLSQACYDHSRDIGPKGITGHTGSDGSQPHDRVFKYVTASMAGENLSFSDVNTGDEVILQLLIDDGVTSRGHRHNIMNPDYTHLGVSCGCHKVYREMCCLAYGRDVKEKDVSIKANIAPQLQTCNAYDASTSGDISGSFNVPTQTVTSDSEEGASATPPPNNQAAASPSAPAIVGITDPIVPASAIPTGVATQAPCPYMEQMLAMMAEAEKEQAARQAEAKEAGSQIQEVTFNPADFKIITPDGVKDSKVDSSGNIAFGFDFGSGGLDFGSIGSNAGSGVLDFGSPTSGSNMLSFTPTTFDITPPTGTTSGTTIGTSSGSALISSGPAPTSSTPVTGTSGSEPSAASSGSKDTTSSVPSSGSSTSTDSGFVFADTFGDDGGAYYTGSGSGSSSNIISDSNSFGFGFGSSSDDDDYHYGFDSGWWTWDW